MCSPSSSLTQASALRRSALAASLPCLALRAQAVRPFWPRPVADGRPVPGSQPPRGCGVRTASAGPGVDKWIWGIGEAAVRQGEGEKGFGASNVSLCACIPRERERESGALLGRWGVRLFTGQLRRWAGWWIAGLETNKQTQLYICI